MSTAVRWFQQYFLAERPAGAVVADLTWNLNPKTSFQKLKQHNFTKKDIVYYSTLTFFLMCAFFLNPAPLIAKSVVALLLLTLLVVPVTSQFFLYGLPVLAWVFFFFSSHTISAKYRPPITVKVLPAVETILYGDNLSQILATYTSPLLDILAWLPYGLIHFSLPFVVAALIFLWGPPTALRSFGFAFGLMNLLGVINQLVFPAAPPWYKILHGLDPANYSMLGSPGGLARIDELLHLDMYTTNFSKNSPVVFGAFPSLHSGSATMDALFLSWLFPRATPVFIVYVMWLWWSTMYLTHHYFIDVMAGSFFALAVFLYTKYTHLPVNDKNAKNRWSYAEVKKLDVFKNDPFYLEQDIETSIGITRFRSGSISGSLPHRTPATFEMDVLQRQRTIVPIPTTPGDESDSSPEIASVFDVDSAPRSTSRSSNTSATSVDSQYDLSTPINKPRRD
jgi:membrane-associated phospholipid phosphatase